MWECLSPFTLAKFSVYLVINIPILYHQYPSMGPGLMQGAPPSMNMPPQQPLMRSSSVESISPRWMPPQQMPYASAVPPSNIFNIICGSSCYL